MGLLDDIVQGALGGQQGSGQGAGGLLEMVMGIINSPQVGGLAGLINMFTNKGLGDVASSWVSTGENMPISAEQLRDVLGSDQIEQIASQLNMPGQDALSGLTSMLPQVVDKLTPDGQIPDEGVLDQGISQLKEKLFG
jgi:uncharacterized protein YidB (DUF937 family)